MSQRLDETATEYRAYSPIPRIALFDIAYPSSEAELREMAGHAVVLITMLSQSSSELPPARIFLRLGAEERELKLITGGVSASQPGTIVATVFGGHRWDGLYLLPMHFVRDGALVGADFAANRVGFVVAKFTDSDLRNLSYLKDVPPPPETDVVEREIVMRFIAREYPGFVSKQ
jgi:hypothetical protein